MGKYFGTDGVRGIVNNGLDSRLAYRVGHASATILAEGKSSGRPLISIGRDTRISGHMLEAALIAGLCDAGADVMVLGVIPTPAVAFIACASGADAGIVISASHNPYEHNGIKIFNGKGFKLSDEQELRIEELIDHPERLVHKQGGEIGRVINKNREYIDRYIDHVADAAEYKIKGLKVIIDCANGAATRTAGEIFNRFPIELEIIKNNPDGENINAGCGSIYPELLSRMVVAGGYDLGLAFDGDADRCIAVDETGSIIDGDKIMAVCGVAMKKKGRLNKDTIVATVMSNMGFHKYAQKREINLQCTNVGDRYVLEKMLECGYNLGGEQSGHLIFLDDATTGDGQLAAVKFLGVVSEWKGKVSELVGEIQTYPQILKNVEISGGNQVKAAVMSDPNLLRAIEDEKRRLGERGRVLVRPSGTEALIRVMVEAENEQEMLSCTKTLTNLIEDCSKLSFC